MRSYAYGPVRGEVRRYLNRVGERVTEGQVSAAMRAAGVEAAGFTVFAKGGDIPSYVLAIEGQRSDPGIAGAFDAALAERNVEYAGKRRSGDSASPPCRR